VENGAMWIPHLMDQLDLTYRRMPKEFAEHPLDTFQRNFWINPFGEDDIHELLRHVPPERVLFGSDYPHPEGLAEPVRFADAIMDLPAKDLERIMGGNLAGLMGVKLTKAA
jgi:predicted TIM-barrel fold metal-dependent hydrolase